MDYDWTETENGNWVLLDDGVVATVYKARDEWGAVWAIKEIGITVSRFRLSVTDGETMPQLNPIINW